MILVFNNCANAKLDKIFENKQVSYVKSANIVAVHEIFHLL